MYVHISMFLVYVVFEYVVYSHTYRRSTERGRCRLREDNMNVKRVFPLETAYLYFAVDGS
jgi:hypothetical protein